MTPFTPKEELLIGRCLRKDATAFEEIAETYGGIFFGFILMLAKGDAALGEEILKRAFVRVFRNPDSLQLDRSLYVELIEKILIGFKRHAFEGKTPQPVEGFSDSFRKFHDPVTLVRLQFLLKGFAALEMQDRILILLRDQLFLTYTEMSELLHKPEAELKTQLTKVRFTVRELMGKQMRAMS